MINKILSKLIDVEIKNTDDEFDLKLINRYLLFLFFLFLFYSIFIISFFGDAITSTFLICITFFWLLLMSLKDRIVGFRKFLKRIIIAIFIILTFIVSFFYIYTWKNGGVEYFYFSLLFTLPFYFNYKDDYYAIFIIVIIITLNFTGCLYLDLDFMPKSKFITPSDFKIIQLLNIIFSVSTFLIDIFFVSQKDKLIYGLMRDTKIKDSTIVDLVKLNNELIAQQVITNNLTEENISEILDLAEHNSPFFLERFQFYFPDFVSNIIKINPGLIHSELHLCALMRLNFDTKKIALCTNNSVRAVESRKYRLRKKLGISSDISINSFMLKV